MEDWTTELGKQLIKKLTIQIDNQITTSFKCEACGNISTVTYISDKIIDDQVFDICNDCLDNPLIKCASKLS